MNRRTFLAAASSSLTIAGMEPVPYGVIGVGQRGRAHIERIAELRGAAYVAAVADVEEDSLHQAARLLPPSVKAYRSAAALLEDRAVEAVVVATPNFLHREHAEAAFAAGKHVLCEKPLATTIGDAQAILDASRRSGKVLLPGHELRFAPAYLALGEQLRQGRIGTICQIVHQEFRPDWSPFSWKYPDPATGKAMNWRFLNKTSGGTLLEKSLHFVDLFHLVIGANPQAVHCDGGISFYKDGRDTWDHLVLTMRYAGGATASHVLSMFHTPSETELRVLGTKGALSVKGHTALSGYEYGQAQRTIYDSGEGETSVARMHPGDREMHAAFVAAIREKKPLPFDPQIAMDAVVTCLRA
jgi:predicted dehydrogenase